MIELSTYQKNELNRACELAAAPSTHLRPRLFPDGDSWCALYGKNLQEGVAGFGKTPEGAMADFDHNFRCQTFTSQQPTDGRHVQMSPSNPTYFDAAPKVKTTCLDVLGHWTRVEDSMPDDEITVLVWSDSLDDVTLAHHDTEVRDRRGDSGWIMAGHSRVVLGVTHWCEKINPPNADVLVRGESATSITRLPRPLPILGEADCPKCGCGKSVKRHNADWTCQAGCGFHELIDTDRETEQAAFEEWLESTCPSGDVESVHRQWKESSTFHDLFNETNSQAQPPNIG